MSTRGRLIFPQRAEIFRPDTAATEGRTPATEAGSDGGYDSVFREPSLVKADASDKTGDPTPEFEGTPILVPCQVETDGPNEEQRQQIQGNVPDSRLVLVFHARDLEKLGLVLADGNPNIPPNSRLNRILDFKKSVTIWQPRNPPGYFLIEIRSSSFGLSSQQRNLFVSTWEDRQVGALA